MTESLNVGRDGRADILPLEPGCLAVQAEKPTRSREYRAPASADCAAAKGAGSGPAVLHPAVSLVSVSAQGHDDRPAGDLVRWHRVGLRR